MPELPEVEIVRRGLERSLAGRRVTGLALRERRLRWPIDEDLPRWVNGRPLRAVDRRGKYLLLDFEVGRLLIHLGMSGSLRFLAEPPPPGRHDHIDLDFEHGVLRYHDPRRFGAMIWHPTEAGSVLAHPLLARLGIEPFDPAFNGAWLARGTRGRQVSIKQLLLAGQVVVGVGNIYASESLFRAGIRPTVAAGRLSRARCERLAGAIQETLELAIARGGSTLRNYVGTDGEPGYALVDALVYGREGQPCLRCGTPIRMLRQQQRASFYCPNCQR